jgi:hypothetical protein
LFENVDDQSPPDLNMRPGLTGCDSERTIEKKNSLLSPSSEITVYDLGFRTVILDLGKNVE